MVSERRVAEISSSFTQKHPSGGRHEGQVHRTAESNTRSIMCHADQMRGGMERGHGPTLAERGGQRRAAEPDAARHCWVVDAPCHPGRWPGLLVEWRRETEGWFGRVVYGIPDPSWNGVRLIERWIPGQHLSVAQAGTSPVAE